MPGRIARCFSVPRSGAPSCYQSPAVNPLRYPHTAAYLAQLPRGLESNPECRVKGSLLREVLEGTNPQDLLELPEPVRALALAPPPLSAWVPEVPVNVLLLYWSDRLQRESGGPDAMLERAYQATYRLLSAPLYKVLFVLLSPERLLVGMERRWSALRQGTSLEVLAHDRASAHLRMRFPARHYAARHCEIRAASLRASLCCAGAREASVRTELRE